MSQIQIELPDGSKKEYEPGITGLGIAKSIAPGLAKAAIAVKVDGQAVDLSLPITADASVAVLTFDQPEGREVFWHSTSHIMAQAVVDLFPKAKLAIGPSIEEGFYYDFDVEQPFSPEDIEKIEKRMAEIIKEKVVFSREQISRTEAVERYTALGADYKVELLGDLEDDLVSIYHQGGFEDLCRGPHLLSTSAIKAFKLVSSSGAYWRGDEKRQMLQRIYGVSYPKKSMLDDYLHRMEEAKKRDHRTLGKRLQLFHFDADVGAGLVLWLPRGSRVRHEIESFWKEEHFKSGYELVYSPHIAKRDLWDKSGHTEFFSDDMYGPLTADGQLYQLKPMNCPFHIAMYKARRWSYRDLPVRWAELGTVYRLEDSGALHGLARVRGLTQDDAHHFVARENMEQELQWLMDFCLHILRSFGLNDYDIYLSTRPEKAIGDPEDWKRAEAGLATVLRNAGLDFQIDEGGGAFYGPKIDLKIKDAIGRSWQCSTIQFDFSLPERFDLSYINSNGQQQRPFMIHRALLGAIERFFAVLIEHYSGDFPLWLAPVQVKVLPITDSFVDFATDVVDRLSQHNIRAELDDRSEKIGAKIRDAELMKVPYMFVIGAREAEADSVSVRAHGQGDLGGRSVEEAIEMLTAEIASKGIEDKS